MKGVMIKAYHVYDGDPSESSLLVFALSRGKAKMAALNAGLWEYERFVDLSAKRVKVWDEMINSPHVVDTNDEIPNNYPRFYDDSLYI